MLLAPKFVKYKKPFTRKKVHINNEKNYNFRLGEHALISSEFGRITSRQIEATRKLIRKTLKKEAKTWINIFPQTAITKKAQESRMGKGKGVVKYWVALVQKSKLFFEVKGLRKQIIKKTLKSAQVKLSIKTNFFSKF